MAKTDDKATVKPAKTPEQIAASNARKGPRGPKRETVYLLNSPAGFAIFVDSGRDEERDEEDKVTRQKRDAKSVVISTFAEMARVKAAYPADKFIFAEITLEGKVKLEDAK